MGRIGKTDTVPAMLTPGEAVLNKGAAELVGRDNIRRANAMGMRVQGFEQGIDEVKSVPVTQLASANAANLQNAQTQWQKQIDARNTAAATSSAPSTASSRLANAKGYSASGPAAAAPSTDMNGDYYASRAEQLGLMSRNPAPLAPTNTLGAGSTLNAHLGDDSAPGTKYVGGIKQAGAEAWGKQAERDTITPSIADSNQKPAYPQYGMQRPAAAQASSLQAQAAQSDYLSEFENWAKQQDQELQGFATGVGYVDEVPANTDRILYSMHGNRPGYQGPNTTPAQQKTDIAPTPEVNSDRLKFSMHGRAASMPKDSVADTSKYNITAQDVMQQDKPEFAPDYKSTVPTWGRGMNLNDVQSGEGVVKNASGMVGYRQMPDGTLAKFDAQGNKVGNLGSYLGPQQKAGQGAIDNPLARETEARLARIPQEQEQARIAQLTQMATNPEWDGSFTGLGMAKRQQKYATDILEKEYGLKAAKMHDETTRAGQNLAADTALKKAVYDATQDSEKEKKIGERSDRQFNLDAMRFGLQTKQAFEKSEQRRLAKERTDAAESSLLKMMQTNSDLTPEQAAVQLYLFNQRARDNQPGVEEILSAIQG